MTEKEDALSDLNEAGVIAGLTWAWDSARRHALLSYDRPTGHTQGWLGSTAWTLLVDRLDRVFSCGRFTVAPSGDKDAETGDDILAEGLLPGEHDTMPHLAPGLVVRHDLNGSDGWRYKEWRWLLQSFGGMDIDSIPWPRMKPTKKLVALQPAPHEPVIPGFEQLMAIDVLEEISDTPAIDLPIVTLVLAWAINAHTEKSELFFGRPRYNKGRTEAWHWRTRLDQDHTDGGYGAKPLPVIPPDSSPQPVRDVEVRLRSTAKEGNSQKDGR
ncbi:hypothetical protein AB0B56_25810 [Streptosporangium canum]|uniref:hypothetical protein n=1 Tax=Streptosporangium canum TaxID=324952 RepID=UPI0034429936